MTSRLRRACLIILCVASVALAAAPVTAKTLRMAYDSDPVSLDPHEQLSSATLQLSHLVMDPLVRWTKDHHIEARLATRWERIDDLTMRFHLREGVKFHSGRTMTSADVKWTFDRLRRSPDFKGLFEPFADAKIIDDHTIDLVTKQPYALVLNLATYIFPMDRAFFSGTAEDGKPKDAIVKNGNSFASGHSMGTGPFIIAQRQQGVRMVLERFRDYWDKGSPGNVDEIVFTPIKEGPTRVAALLAGDVDFIAPVPPTDLDRLKGDPSVNLVTLPGARIIMLQMNEKRVAAFQDVRVRQAMVYAVNNDAIAKKILRGFAVPAGQMSPKGFAGHDPALKPRYDIAKAKKLMKEAGYEKGFRVSMLAPNNRYVSDYRTAQAVAAMLAKINITVDLKTLPKAQYWPQFDARAADIMMIGWHPDTEDSANFAEFLAMTPDPDTGYGQYNAGNYSNPKVDALVLKSHAMTDTAARARVLQKVETILYNDAAFIPLHWQNLAWAARKGVDIAAVLNPQDFPYLGDLVME